MPVAVAALGVAMTSLGVAMTSLGVAIHETVDVGVICAVTLQRKKLGAWGEAFLDEQMCDLGWSVLWCNRRFAGGEVDRVYQKPQQDGRKLRLCAVEVKTLGVWNTHQFERLTGSAALDGCVRRGQLRTLKHAAEFWNARAPQSTQVQRWLALVVAMSSEVVPLLPQKWWELLPGQTRIVRQSWFENQHVLGRVAWIEVADCL
jgi:Holliday junction resolvase-like predicted endonuclease